MDGLCDLTSKTRGKPAHVDIPAPDYDGAPTIQYINDTNTGSYRQFDQDLISKQFIRKNMSREIKEISKDITMRSKQDIQKRPEFLAKQHQLKSSALKKQAEKDKEENNELFAKLKSRSQVIDQVEKEKEEEENLPEFMKVKLKGKEPTSVSS